MPTFPAPGKCGCHSHWGDCSGQDTHLGHVYHPLDGTDARREVRDLQHLGGGPLAELVKVTDRLGDRRCERLAVRLQPRLIAELVHRDIGQARVLCAVKAVSEMCNVLGCCRNGIVPLSESCRANSFGGICVNRLRACGGPIRRRIHSRDGRRVRARDRRRRQR